MLTNAQKKAQKKYSEGLKRKVLSFYSDGTLVCACCGESEYAFLTMDHIDGGGNEHRKETGWGHGAYIWLAKNKYPEGFQVLCMNCNFAKGKLGTCPHQLPKTKPAGESNENQ